MSRNKANGKFRNRTDEILFIDARNMGHLINRRTREFSAKDIQKIADTYHAWRSVGANLRVRPDSDANLRVCPDADLRVCPDSDKYPNNQNTSEHNQNTGEHAGSPLQEYIDIKGFCNSASIEKVRKLDYVLTPGRYVGLAVEDDDFDFNERFSKLKTEFEEQLKEEAKLNVLIAENLEKVKVNTQDKQN